MMGRSVARAVSGAVDGVRARLALSGAAKVGPGVRLFGWPTVVAEGRLVIGRDVVFVSTPAPVSLFVATGAELVIGDGAVIESGAIVRAGRSVVLGPRSRIGVGCVVDDGGAAAGILVADEGWLDDGAVLVGGAIIRAGARVARGGVVGGEAAPPVAPAGFIDGEARTLSEREDRVREVVGRILPSAARAPHGVDLRLFKGWDSLAALRILVALEKEFAVTLPHELFSRQHTIASLVPWVLGTTAGPSRSPS